MIHALKYAPLMLFSLIYLQLVHALHVITLGWNQTLEKVLPGVISVTSLLRKHVSVLIQLAMKLHVQTRHHDDSLIALEEIMGV